MMPMSLLGVFQNALKMRVKAMAKRSRNDILVFILELLTETPLKKTQIMFKSNISWHTLNEALNTLLEKKLIEKEPDKSHFYKITERGSEVLNFQRKARNSLS